MDYRGAGVLASHPFAKNAKGWGTRIFMRNILLRDGMPDSRLGAQTGKTG